MKLYYDCPIIARYMQEYFGVQYIDNRGCPVNIYDNGGYYFISGDVDKDTDSPDEVYIAPESLPIFKPIVGDLCRIQWLDKSISFREIDHADFLPEAALDRDIRILLQIIQRNEKPFFTPIEE